MVDRVNSLPILGFNVASWILLDCLILDHILVLLMNEKWNFIALISVFRSLICRFRTPLPSMMMSDNMNYSARRVQRLVHRKTSTDDTTQNRLWGVLSRGWVSSELSLSCHKKILFDRWVSLKSGRGSRNHGT